MAIIEKMHNFCPILMKSGENDASWGNYFHHVSWRLDKNCEFLLMVNSWECLGFFYSDLRNITLW